MNKKDYFVFDGQNASTGTAHPITGRMSFYGEIMKFHSKEEALEYVDNYRGSDICKAGVKSTMRKYCLGISVESFERDLEWTDYRTFNEETGYWE